MGNHPQRPSRAHVFRRPQLLRYLVEQWYVHFQLGTQPNMPHHNGNHLKRKLTIVVSWDQFARDWNRPVHVFLLRHVYHSSISSMKVNKHTATLITFFLSACIHELVMWCLFNKLRGYLLVLQMCQLPVRFRLDGLFSGACTNL